MGAMISFELARHLRRHNRPQPVELFVSGRSAPQMPPIEPPTYDLPDEEFRQELRRLKGTPEEVLSHPELMQLMTPILRADFSVCQTYAYTPEQGDSGTYEIYPSCVPVVGDLREPLNLPVACRLHMSPSPGLTGGDAILTGGWLQRPAISNAPAYRVRKEAF